MKRNVLEPGAHVRVECDITGLDPQPHLLEWLRGVLACATSRVGVEQASIGRVVIASHDRYGRAVNSIRPGAGYTDNQAGVSGGKTIARMEGDNVVSDVVLQACHFERLAAVWADPVDPAGWPVDEQQAFYVICHEFGHALDHAIRRDVADITDPRAGSFSIRAAATYYGVMVLTEYVACRNAASTMPRALFGHEMAEAGRRMQLFQRQTKACLDDPQSLTRRALAHTVCQGAWALMVELARLYGHAAGTAARMATVRELETALIEGTPLGAALETTGASYPAWDLAALTGQLEAVWEQFAGCFGVRFVHRAEGTDDLEPLKVPGTQS